MFYIKVILEFHRKTHFILKYDLSSRYPFSRYFHSTITSLISKDSKVHDSIISSTRLRLPLASSICNQLLSTSSTSRPIPPAKYPKNSTYPILFRAHFHAKSRGFLIVSFNPIKAKFPYGVVN